VLLSAPASYAVDLSTLTPEFTFSFDENLNSQASIPGTAPWLTAAFFNTGTPNQVAIRLTNLLLPPPPAQPPNSENFITQLGFNIGDSSFNPSTLQASIDTSCDNITGLACPIPPPVLSVYTPIPPSSQGINLANGAQGFDIAINFENENSPVILEPLRFRGGDVVDIYLTGAGLTASLFNNVNQPGTGTGLVGNLCAAARVQGIVPSNGFTSDSSTIAARCPGEIETPTVPAPLPLFGSAMAFAYTRKLRKRIHASQAAQA
jgi:hypothetical protein